MKNKDVKAILVTVAGMAIYELIVKDVLKNFLKGLGTAGGSGSNSAGSTTK